MLLWLKSMDHSKYEVRNAENKTITLWAFIPPLTFRIPTFRPVSNKVRWCSTKLALCSPNIFPGLYKRLIQRDFNGIWIDLKRL